MSIMGKLVQASIVVQPLPNGTFLEDQDNFHRLQCQYPFNGANHDPHFVIGGTSTAKNLFSVIPTPSSGDLYVNRLSGNPAKSYNFGEFDSKNNKMEAIKGNHNFTKDDLGFSKEIHHLNVANSQPIVGSSLVPPLINPYVSMTPFLLDELSCITGVENSDLEVDDKVAIVGKNEKRKHVQGKRIQIVQSNEIKGQ
ncbi:hypothetical protein RIF29_26576 [Crotalaria pallida]|uniref:Uncharacterized protein n=1 Tax=Crotalaria pallida TaxID=3830 RepID=A0AAN9ENG9_CROPI